MKHGIYQIRNLINGNRYIGSAAGKGFDNRWALHKTQLGKGYHHSSKLQHAWNKHGADSFVFEILLYCDPENCLMYEQIALDYLKPKYNINPIACSRLNSKHTAKSKRLMSQSKTGNKSAKGSIRSESYKKHLSVINSGENNPRSKVTQQDVLVIKKLVHSGMQQKIVAQQFSISKSLVSSIIRGERW